MFAAAIALTLAFAPPDTSVVAEPPAEPAPAETEPAETEPAPAETELAPEVARNPGTIVLAPERAGEYRLYDHTGSPIGAPLQLGDGKQSELQLPAGVYHVHGPTGIDTIVIVEGPTLAWDGARVIPRDVWAADLEQRRLDAELAASQPAALAAAPPQPRSNWRVWASPLGSAVVPGLGQFFNGQGGKATGLLFGTLGSAAGAGVLYSLGNDGTRPLGSEYARLIGYGTLSTTAMLLWVYGIADAYRVASGKRVRGHVDHRVRVSLSRMMTVGFRADDSRPGFYDDWSVSIMGQAARRFSIGVSDLSVKPGGVGGPQVWQLGLRLDYRVVERERLWLDLAVGSLFQIAVGQQAAPLDPELGAPASVTRLGAVPYGQLDLRVFVLDRLSIDLVPRLAIPVTTRYYSVNRALPRYAPELELGAGLSTYF